MYLVRLIVTLEVLGCLVNGASLKEHKTNCTKITNFIGELNPVEGNPNKVRFNCPDGLQRIGRKLATCKDDGTWSNKPPLCTNIDAKCKFEKDFCGWTQDSNDQRDWVRKVWLAKTGNTGPQNKKDKWFSNLGYYILFNASAPAVSGDEARLLSPMYNSSTIPMCFDFLYYILGPKGREDVGSLAVYVLIGNSSFINKTQPHFKKEGNQDKKRGKIELGDTDEPYRIMFVARKAVSNNSDIVVDDVRLYNCTSTTKSSSETAAETESSAEDFEESSEDFKAPHEEPANEIMTSTLIPAMSSIISNRQATIKPVVQTTHTATTQPTSKVTSLPTSAVRTQPTSRIPTQLASMRPRPTSIVPTQPTSAVSTQPTSIVPTQPTSTVPTQPISTVPKQPKSIVTTQPTSTVPKQPISTVPKQPTSTVITHSSSSVTTQPTSTVATQSTSMATTQVTSTVTTQPTSAVTTQPTLTVPTQPTSTVTTQPTLTVPTQPTSMVKTQPTPTVKTQPTSMVTTQPTSTITEQQISTVTARPIAKYTKQQTLAVPTRPISLTIQATQINVITLSLSQKGSLDATTETTKQSTNIIRSKEPLTAVTHRTEQPQAETTKTEQSPVTRSFSPKISTHWTPKTTVSTTKITPRKEYVTTTKRATPRTSATVTTKRFNVTLSSFRPDVSTKLAKQSTEIATKATHTTQMTSMTTEIKQFQKTTSADMLSDTTKSRTNIGTQFQHVSTATHTKHPTTSTEQHITIGPVSNPTVSLDKTTEATKPAKKTTAGKVTVTLVTPTIKPTKQETTQTRQPVPTLYPKLSIDRTTETAKPTTKGTRGHEHVTTVTRVTERAKQLTSATRLTTKIKTIQRPFTTTKVPKRDMTLSNPITKLTSTTQPAAVASTLITSKEQIITSNPTDTYRLAHTKISTKTFLTASSKSPTDGQLPISTTLLFKYMTTVNTKRHATTPLNSSKTKPMTKNRTTEQTILSQQTTKQTANSKQMQKSDRVEEILIHVFIGFGIGTAGGLVIISVAVLVSTLRRQNRMKTIENKLTQVLEPDSTQRLNGIEGSVQQVEDIQIQGTSLED